MSPGAPLRICWYCATAPGRSPPLAVNPARILLDALRKTFHGSGSASVELRIFFARIPARVGLPRARAEQDAESGEENSGAEQGGAEEDGTDHVSVSRP